MGLGGWLSRKEARPTLPAEGPPGVHRSEAPVLPSPRRTHGALPMYLPETTVLRPVSAASVSWVLTSRVMGGAGRGAAGSTLDAAALKNCGSGAKHRFSCDVTIDSSLSVPRHDLANAQSTSWRYQTVEKGSSSERGRLDLILVP